MPYGKFARERYMDNIAALANEERHALIMRSAADRGVVPAIIEKDFWVCWVLMRLFTDAFLADILGASGFSVGLSSTPVRYRLSKWTQTSFTKPSLGWRHLGMLLR